MPSRLLFVHPVLHGPEEAHVPVDHGVGRRGQHGVPDPVQPLLMQVLLAGGQHIDTPGF